MQVNVKMDLISIPLEAKKIFSLLGLPVQKNLETTFARRVLRHMRIRKPYLTTDP